MMAGLLRWNPSDELHRFTETFDRLTNRWRSGSAWVDSPTHASVNGSRMAIASASVLVSLVMESSRVA